MDVYFVNSHRYKNLRSCLVFYRHENVLECELICMITGVLFIHAIDCTLFLISHYTSHQINRDVSCFRVVMFSVVWLCLMSGLYFMPARDYACCFLYILLHLTKSLLTCWYTIAQIRSMCYLSSWEVAGFVTCRLYTHINNLVRSMSLYW